VRDHGNGRATFAAVQRHDITEQFRVFLHNNAAAVRSMMSERDEDLTESGLSAHGHNDSGHAERRRRLVGCLPTVDR
jgi:hypothetical protein